MDEKKHWLRPLKGKQRPNRHLLLWIDADDGQPILKVTGNRAWDVVAVGKEVRAWNLGSWFGRDGLDALLDRATQGKGTLTIWLYRGWEDLVLSGLAELLDCKACSWRYCLLDGQKVLIRGLYRGKSITITSLANWTNQWRHLAPNVTGDEQVRRCLTAFDGGLEGDAPALAGRERDYIGTWLACALASALLGCPTVAPSVAGAALAVWRVWLGPRLTVKMTAKKKRTKSPTVRSVTFVAPSPFRPVRSQHAERHCVYGLMARQLRRGLVDEPIHVVDLQSAFLLTLCTCPIPIQYRCVLHRPSREELAQRLQDHTGHALCRIDTADNAYPVRYGRKVHFAQGRYWTWLAGTELAMALLAGECREVYTAYLWGATLIPADVAEGIMGIGPDLKRRGCHAMAAAWRSIYSSLVGRFAGRRKVWQDIPPRPGVDNWCEWTVASTRTAEIQQCRSVAGKHQRLDDRADTSDSVPLLYACVTAHVRALMLQLYHAAGPENCVCINADSLWITRAGWQRYHAALSAQGMSVEYLTTKAVYDRAWMTGKSVCVVEHKGQRILKAPGCGDGIVLDEMGRWHGLRAVPWSQCQSVKASKGVRRRKVCFAGDRVIRDYGAPAVAVPLGEKIDDLLLRAELLEPVKSGKKVEDE